MNEIAIDFVSGSHGNYLEFVLNKLIYGDLILIEEPFDVYGSSHAKRKAISYAKHKLFKAAHYFNLGGCTHNNIVSIFYTYDDLLPLMSVSLLRSGECGILDTDLHINTFNKLNNKYYKPVLDKILSSYNTISEYNDIKADEWPDITTVDEFYQLPMHIQIECREVFGYVPVKVTADETNPDIDRCILRQFFKFSFKTPELNGFITHLNKMTYNSTQCVYKFPFSAFYDTNEFLEQLANIAKFFNLTFEKVDIVSLHNKFISHQPFYNLTVETDAIIHDIINNIPNNIKPLTLFQECYINAKLELYYDIDFPLKQPNYFQSTTQLRDYINEIQK